MARASAAERATKVPELRSGDRVIVLTGKDAGKQGDVERLVRPDRVVVGGIIDIARPIQSSNVMLVCPNCHMPTRMRHEKAADGRSVRTCSRCGETVTRVEGTK